MFIIPKNGNMMATFGMYWKSKLQIKSHKGWNIGEKLQT